VSLALALDPTLHGLSLRLADVFAERGEELVLVGGLVRDALLGAPAGQDLDFATSARPPSTRPLLRAAGAGAIYDVGERFGTIGAVFGDVKVEVTTYRAESYQAGSRKPDVTFSVALRDDLARRDFTINAIGYDPRSGDVHDPFDGLADLRDGVVRAVGDAEERFAEDPLRLLRAVRFASVLGFRVEPATATAARSAAPSLETISRERVRDELNKLLCGPYPALGIQLLCDLGLAPYSLPSLLAMRGMRQEAGRYKDVFTHTLQVLDRTPPRLTTRWAALLHDVAKPSTLSVVKGQVHFFGHDVKGARMARRILLDLRQDTHLAEQVSRLVGLHLRANAYESGWTDGAVRRFVREIGDDLLRDLLMLSRADVTSRRADRRLAIARNAAELERRIVELRAQEDIARLASPLDGVELMTMFGRGPGPWIKVIKDHLLELVLDGTLGQDDRERAAEIARQVYAERRLGAEGH
jgi:poly(A) polymerase